MSIEKNLDQIHIPTLCFGDITRDEINDVLKIAGVSLYPPVKTPFVTGIEQQKAPVVIQSPKPVVQKEVNPTVNKSETTNYTIIAKDKKEQIQAAQQHQQKLTPTKKEKKQQQQQQQQHSKYQPLSTAIATTTTHNATATNAATAPATPIENGMLSPAVTTPVISNTEPASPQPKITKAPVSSWAALLKKPEPVKRPAGASASSTAQQSQPTAVNGTAANGKVQISKKPTTPTPTISTRFTGLADMISKYEPNYTAPLIQPRGLINNVNTCFMNVILQPLLHCAPFYNLIKTISSQVVHSFKSKTLLLDSIIEFINEFPIEKPDDLEPYGEPFVPEYVYNALREQQKFDTLRGRQEDSEEFLCFLLDGLHEEMTAVLKEQNDKREAEAAAAKAAAGNNDEWLEVGANNKTSNLRPAVGFEESFITKIFSGKVRSILRCPGAKDSINLEPFQSFPLDIQPENVHSIEDAIAIQTLPETMHDYTSPKGLKVDATKQVYLEHLPPVLVLHMKRFVFDNVGGVQKLCKRVNYGSKLVIDREWMAPPSRPVEPITYQLIGCVYHHGTSAGGGHYTCDIRRRNGEWLHIDDTNITSVSEKDVLVNEEDNTHTSERSNADNQTAYILFYVRSS
ncbi:hypothetical protein BDF20DRAFT_906728 [Mycotypha africana]|uniref:uncharacterized protein n=1 Tax=Mycotypha africana TaxID=64632 RepID=UPI002301DD86|nr:uncharacterized protein BDF20DRAFT_906728 [Mycotypha africana]KAI8975379.1 hypothetical protein BDF20DRAFT_906728 [Mycotypha africana]